ncbi:MAG TPA: prepilin-type N-terminal cleavage/methylation domain-containing protein [Candidatus Paceibacterota bacterium]
MHKKFSKKFTQGFTLIELLVVIAIIGILASIVLVSLNGARGKGRDAKRISELQQIARVVAIADADPAVDFACTTFPDVSTCTTPSGFAQFKDPTTPGTNCALTGALTGACQYALSQANGSADAASPNNVSTQNWRVRTWLETGAGTLTTGAVCISSATSTPFQGAGC